MSRPLTQIRIGALIAEWLCSTGGSSSFTIVPTVHEHPLVPLLKQYTQTSACNGYSTSLCQCSGGETFHYNHSYIRIFCQTDVQYSVCLSVSSFQPQRTFERSRDAKSVTIWQLWKNDCRNFMSHYPKFWFSNSHFNYGHKSGESSKKCDIVPESNNINLQS